MRDKADGMTWLTVGPEDLKRPAPRPAPPRWTCAVCGSAEFDEHNAWKLWCASCGSRRLKATS